MHCAVLSAFLSCGILMAVASLRVTLNDPGCGKRKVSRRIVGGISAEEGQFPWMVFLVATGPTGKKSICGATIITPYHLLTAAHCTVTWTNKNVVAMNAYYGSAILRKTVKVPVTRVLRHEAYVGWNDQNDISLLEVKEPFNFDGTSVVPICIPTDTVHIAGNPVVVAGWGLTNLSFPRSASSNLLYTTVKVLPSLQCLSIYISHNNVLRYDKGTMHCAYAQNTDACKGDSGGPMMASMADGRFVQLGLVVSGVGCASKLPGLYTRVDAFHDWIRRNINNSDAFQTL